MLRLTKLHVKNFRSIYDESFVFTPLTTLIGKNDAGKSNLLEAIRLLFEGAPSDLAGEDFYDLALAIEIVGILEGVDEYLELCDKQNRAKIEALIADGGKLMIRRVAAGPKALGKIEIWDPADSTFKATPTGIDAPLKAMLFEIISIGALADVRDEVKGTQRDALGRLLGRIIAEVSEKVEPDLTQAYQEAQSKLNVLADGSDNRVQELKDLEAEVTKYLRETFPRDAVRLQVALPVVKDILGKIEVLVAEGQTIDPYYRKGQGLQRALYLSLLRTLAARIRAGTKKAVSQPFMILFEEPEAFLHPAGQAKMRAALQTIASTGQVVLSTHSPIMLHPDSIGQALRIEKRLEGDLGKPITRRHGPIDPAKLTDQQKLFLKLFSLQRSSRFLFSRGVLLVEGEGDEHLIDAILETAGIRCEECEIAIIEVGGKDAIHASAEILRMLGLDVWSVVDLDFLWRGAGVILKEDANLSQLVEEAKKIAQYDEIPDNEKKAKLTEAVGGEVLAGKRDAVIEKLASHGIYVLRSGEIEHYVGLGKHGKGEYLKVAGEVRRGDRKIVSPEDFLGVTQVLAKWATAGG